MGNDALVLRRPEQGFSLVELLIVVAIIVIMAAVALPNIGRYLRNYKIGAAQQVAGRDPGGADQGDHRRTRTAASRSSSSTPTAIAGCRRTLTRAGNPQLEPAHGPARRRALRLRRRAARDRRSASTAWAAAATRRAGDAGAPPVARPLRCRRRDALRPRRRAPLHRHATRAITGRRCVITLLEENTQPAPTVRIAPGGRVLPQP